MACCEKCIHCICSAKFSTEVTCDVFGDTREMCACRYYMTEKEYKEYKKLQKKLNLKETKENE